MLRSQTREAEGKRDAREVISRSCCRVQLKERERLGGDPAKLDVSPQTVAILHPVQGTWTTGDSDICSEMACLLQPYSTFSDGCRRIGAAQERIFRLTFCPGGTLRGSRIDDKAIRRSWWEWSLLSWASQLPNPNPPEPDESPRYCPVRRVPSPLPSPCFPLPRAHSWRRQPQHVCDWGARRGTRPARAPADAKSIRRNLGYLSPGCGQTRRMGLLHPRWKHEAGSGRGFECCIVLFLSIFL